MDSRTRRIPALTLLMLLAAITFACGSSTPTTLPSAAQASGTASPSTSSGATAGPTATSPSSTASASSARTSNPSADLAVYAQIETQVQEMRQLRATKSVTPTLLDEAGVKAWMTKNFQDNVDHEALAAQSRLFVHLGLLPAGASLEQLQIDLNSSQAIGFYDPDSGGLYLLSEGGKVGPEQKLTFSHEFTHELQDQNFSLNKLAIDTVDQGDRDLARIALPEGDATLSMTQWAETHMSMSDLLSVSLSGSSADQMKQLNEAPAILRADLLFPYEQGLTFVQGIYSSGGWSAVDAVYKNPPSSTSQILHPELYRSGVQPVAVTLPAVPSRLGSGWKLAMQDTMGEFQLGIWLDGEHPSSSGQSAAEAAVNGWAGDRIGLYEGPNGAWAVVLRTTWRSTGAEGAFRAAVGPVLSALKSPSTECGGGLNEDIVIASDQTKIPDFLACKSGA
jgi:hypothetical protein